MLARHWVFSSVYLLIFILNIWMRSSPDEAMHSITMPLIGMSLIFYLLIRTKLKGAFNKKIFIGLTLAMAGDMLLIFASGAEFLFLMAIAATLLGYLAYLMAFYDDVKGSVSASNKYGVWVAAVFVTISLSFLVLLHNYLRDYKIPVIIHVFILTLLPILAAYRYNRVSFISFKLVLLAAVCFVISDFSIGYSNFVQASSFLMQLFISAYMLAQYLLVLGSIERQN